MAAMMGRVGLMLVWVAMLVGAPAQAQDDPYAIALERIEAARESGATELNLNGLGLTQLPPEVFNLTDLQVLYLGDNQLTALPSAISNLNNLQWLDLHNNRLTTLPPDIGNLINLQQLYLGDNQLTTLPRDIGNLINLQWLGLGGNQLTILPPDIGNLINLQWLTLHNNRLTTLPISIGDMPLGGFSAEDNPLVFPPPEIVAQGSDAVLAFLREPRPYPPYRMSTTVIGTMVALVVSLIVSSAGVLALWRR